MHRQRDAAGDLIPAAELRERADAAARRRESEREARAAWELGDVVPHRITLALNIRQLYGPQVDEQCGVKEPAVDEWEAGTRYPSWEQLLALAELVEFDVRFFTPDDPAAGAFTPDDVVFACYRSRRNHNPRVEIPPPILHFDPASVAAAVGGYCAGCVGHPLPHTCEQDALFDLTPRKGT